VKAKQAALADFYDAPIDFIEDRTPCTLPNSYLIGWFSDRDVEYLAAGKVTDAMQERAKTLLMWKNRYWQGMDTAAADGAQELYLELVSYGLGEA
jgi:hypothetical protein